MTNPIDELIEKLRNHSAFVFVDDARLMHDAASTLTSLQERIRKLEDALRDFLENPLFQVAVGGNPNAVEEMLARNRALLPESGE